MAKAVLEVDGNGNRTHDQVARGARDPNFAYARLTANTRKQLSKLLQAYGRAEPMGFLWMDRNTKELHTWECPDYGVSDFQALECRMFNNNGFTGRIQVNGLVFIKCYKQTDETNSQMNPTHDDYTANERKYA